MCNSAFLGPRPCIAVGFAGSHGWRCSPFLLTEPGEKTCAGSGVSPNQVHHASYTTGARRAPGKKEHPFRPYSVSSLLPALDKEPEREALVRRKTVHFRGASSASDEKMRVRKRRISRAGSDGVSPNQVHHASYTTGARRAPGKKEHPFRPYSVSSLLPALDKEPEREALVRRKTVHFRGASSASDEPPRASARRRPGPRTEFYQKIAFRGASVASDEKCECVNVRL